MYLTQIKLGKKFVDETGIVCCWCLKLDLLYTLYCEYDAHTHTCDASASDILFNVQMCNNFITNK